MGLCNLGSESGDLARCRFNDPETCRPQLITCLVLLAELAGWLTGSLADQMDDWRDAKSPARQTVGTPSSCRQPSRRIVAVALGYLQAAEPQTQATRHQERKLPGRQITKLQGCQTSKPQAPKKPSGCQATPQNQVPKLQ